ncbi:autophagy-related protein 6 [Fusarium flagelliforme]|uniref:Autophagy-related protein 6 n=1 Tax=Fusarium flagelliforme TaxID=2675880 RepID=A0A395MZC6_9HYPO|nr:autophagy-related protein 6 [Fusarium flagelliforme]
MGWISSIIGTDKSADPLAKLDPSLRDFLEKESPLKYPANQPTNPPQATQQPSNFDAAVTDLQTPKPAAPSASLYQDGRYAHIWKNYRPLAEIEAETATDHEKLMGVLEAYKERKEAIGKAALENCAEYQEEHQVRRFERCYMMQSRFLRALGHGSVVGRSPQVEEDIQMHADALYQRMMKHEEAVEKAKAEGLPIPVFKSTLPKAKDDSVVPTEELQQQWKEQLDKLPAEERVVEEAALRADLQAKAEVAGNVQKIWDSQAEQRKQRQAQGNSTFGDYITSLFGKSGK